MNTLISNLSGWRRLFIVLTILWMSGFFAVAIDGSLPGESLAIGIFPPVLLWGIFWIYRGFKQ